MLSKTLVVDSSKNPPVLGGGHADAAQQVPAGSALIEFRTRIHDRRNATTAYSTTRDGHSIQVAFWPAQPPRVSYLSVYCHGREGTDFATEPVVMATKDDLFLLRMVLGPRSAAGNPRRFEYFIYHAASQPALHPIVHPGLSRDIGDCQVGLLRRHDHGRFYYIVAALCYGYEPGHYDLHTFDSRTKVWDTKMALLRQEKERGEHSCCTHSKVIVLGGEGGTMGWVDLQQGILFCDVLCKEPVLRHVALPARLNPNSELPNCFMRTWDIALISGRIKYVEFQQHFVPGSFTARDYIADGWTVATWSRKATTDPFEEEEWQQECMVHASQISVEDSTTCCSELLPKIFDDQGTPLLALKRLHTAHPTLDSHDDDVVYLMAKMQYRDTKAWVLAVDIRNRTLLGATEFVTRRNHGFGFAYMHVQ